MVEPRQIRCSTYSISLASTEIVRQAGDVAWVSHEDRSLDGVDSRSLDGNGSVVVTLIGVSAAAKGIVKDLATLYRFSLLRARVSQ